MFKDCKIPIWQISKSGEVYSKKSNKILKPYLRRGYPSLKYRGKHYYIHVLVAETFIGEIDEGMCVNHKDGNKQNNHVENLEIVTIKENLQHALDNNLRKSVKGSKHGRAKLSDEDATNLIKDIINGIDDEEVAIKYGLSKLYVRNIRQKKRWKHIWERM